MPEAPSLAELGGWPGVLGSLCARRDLDPMVVAAAMAEILHGSATPAQIAGFAVGLRTKGESIEELCAALDAMYAVATRVALAEPMRAAAVDTCGTGGDRSHSINISTAAAFVVAGAGVPVCKHGGRAASSAAGSADVLEALGVVIELSPEGVARCVTQAGVGFCFAPRFHPAMRHAAPVRRELGVATLFNFLGPLANPAGVARQVVGVSDPAMAPKVAGVLARRGSRAMVVFGADGLDELSTTTTSTVYDIAEGRITEQVVDPARLGLATATVADLKGGSAAENAAALRRVLGGAPGSHRDIVVLNAAAALIVSGLASDWERGLDAAGQSIDSGAAAAALDNLVIASVAASAAVTESSAG